MTDYVVTVKQVLVPLTDGQSVMLPRGYQVPADALPATVTHLLALGAIEAGEGASIGGIAPDLDGEGNPIGSAPSPTPPPYVRTVNGEGPDVAGDVNAGGGDTSGLLPIADPAGVTSESFPNLVTGTGTYAAATFPANQPAIALKKAGDDFPWLLVNSSGDGIYLSDGSYDPYDGGVNIYPQGHDLHIASGPGARVVFDSAVTYSGGDGIYGSGVGPVLVDTADGHTYRLVSTNGALTLVEAT